MSEPKGPTEPPANPGPIVQMLDGVRTSATLKAAMEIGIFAQLKRGPKDAEYIAASLRTPLRSTRILMRALVALGLLTERNKKYQLTPSSKAYLVPGRAAYLGELASIVCSPVMWNGFGRLTESIRNDGTVLAQHAETPSNPFWETFARSSRMMSLRVAKKIDKALKEWMEAKPRLRVLDLGAGSGTYGFTLLKRNPNAELTIVEWANVIPEAKKMADRSAIDQRRVKYVSGNLAEVDYGGPFDLVIVSHVLHHLDKPTCAAVMKKIAGALAPGGRVVIHEFVGNDATSQSALFSITMLAWTPRGDAYSIADYEAWLSDAGIAPLWTEPPGELPSTLIIAEERSAASKAVLTNKELLRRFYSMWQGTSRIPAEDVCSAGYRDHMPHPGPKGVEGVKGALEMFRTAFPDSTCSIDMIAGSGNWVTGSSTFRGTHTGQLMNILPTGRRVVMKTVDTVRIAKGKIAEIWHLEDTLGLFIQLGVVPPPG